MSAPPTPTTLALPPVPPAASSSAAQHPPPPHPQIPIQGGAQSTAPGAQLPTLTNTHIRSVADAQKLFYAVQLGLLPKVERRLDAVERKRLQPGDVYVWEERGSGPGFVAQGAAAAAAAHKAEGGEGAPQGYEVGIERWTEGLSWSASRIRDDFLIYFENIKKKEKGVDRDGQRARSLENQVLREGERDMYIKQTYSVLRNDVNQDDGAGPSTAPSASGEKKDVKKKPRKWHLNAYFTKSTEGNLNTIDSIPWLRDIQVPEGIFTSARQSKKGSSSAANAAASASTSAPAAGPSHTKVEPQPDDEPSKVAGAKRGRGREGPSVQRTYAPFPVGESRRHHQRPVVPAPPPPPPPLPPGSMAPPPPPHAGHPMHVDTVHTVQLRPIDTTPAVMRGSPHPPGVASSPVSAGGVHVSTMGMYNMHLGSEGEDPGFHAQQQQQPHFSQSAFMFGEQQAQMQRLQEQQLQQQFGHFRRDFERQQQQQAFYGGAFEAYDFGQGPHSPLAQASPAHSGHSSLSPPLSDFRGASDYGGNSSGSGSSRGASVSSGSGRGQSLTRMGTWSPAARPGSSAGDAFAFGHYLGVKTEFSELGHALGMQPPPPPQAQALPGLAEVVGEAVGGGGAGEDDEDLNDGLRRGPPPPQQQQQQPQQQQQQPPQPDGHAHAVVALGAFAPYAAAADDASAYLAALPHAGGFSGLLLPAASSSSSLAAALAMAVPAAPPVPPPAVPAVPSLPAALAVPGPRRALAPLHQLQRNHPYRRFPMDDRALRMLGPGPAPETRAPGVASHGL